MRNWAMELRLYKDLHLSVSINVIYRSVVTRLEGLRMTYCSIRNFPFRPPNNFRHYDFSFYIRGLILVCQRGRAIHCNVLYMIRLIDKFPGNSQ